LRVHLEASPGHFITVFEFGLSSTSLSKVASDGFLERSHVCGIVPSVSTVGGTTGIRNVLDSCVEADNTKSLLSSRRGRRRRKGLGDGHDYKKKMEVFSFV